MCKRVLRAAVLSWLIASAAHLPIPIWDGDDVGSESAHQCQVSFKSCSHIACELGRFDIDLVLLGCNSPDDPDDGPFDDDPDPGDTHAGTFPDCRCSSDAELLDIDAFHGVSERYVDVGTVQLDQLFCPSSDLALSLLGEARIVTGNALAHVVLRC